MRRAQNRDTLSAREIALLAARAAVDKKAEEPVLVDLGGRSSIADIFLIVSGASERQVLAIADGVIEALKKEKIRVLATEGVESSQWVLIDVGDVIVHVFHNEARAYYDIDGLWADAARLEFSPAAESMASP